MNIDNNYDIENFDSYNNFYTILQKNVTLYKRIQDDENSKPRFEICGEKTKYFPIYGHFYNNENYFIYVKVNNKKLLNKCGNQAYYKTTVDDLAHPLHSAFFKFTDVNELYVTIEELQNNNK